MSLPWPKLTREEWVALLAKSKPRHLSFDPDQARDDHGRWTDTGASPRSEYASSPRVFKTSDSVVSRTDWGETRLYWADKDGKPTGEIVQGDLLSRESLPKYLYHVTTNEPAVMGSGVLLGQHGDAGLGGGTRDGVSFTTSLDDADTIQREMRRSVRIARGDETIDSMGRFAAEDERAADLPSGSLSEAVASVRREWDVNVKHSTYATPESRASLLKDVFNSYLWARESAAKRIGGDRAAEILKNPVLFGDQKKLKTLDPNHVKIVRVPSTNIPVRALVTSGSDKFLHEVRVYADVPVDGAVSSRSAFGLSRLWS